MQTIEKMCDGFGVMTRYAVPVLLSSSLLYILGQTAVEPSRKTHPSLHILYH